MSGVEARFRAPILTLALVSASPAHANDAPSAEVTNTESAIAKAISLAQAGECRAATPELERAEALQHTPRIAALLGECQINLGRLVDGIKNLSLVLQTEVSAPDAELERIQARARDLFERTLPRLAAVTLSIEPSNAQATVTVDGASLPYAFIGVERRFDPGVHEVSVSAQGYVPLKVSMRLREGAHEYLKLSLEPDPNAKLVTSSNQPHLQQVPARSRFTGSNADEHPTLRRVGYATLGFGAAGIAVGTVTGILAAQKASKLDCPGDVCPRDQGDELNAVRRLSAMSTWSFVFGLTSAATGAVILFTTTPTRTTERNRARKTRPSAEAWVSVLSAGVRGRF